MVLLLRASRLLIWPRYDVDACLLGIPFTGKILDASKKAIGVPGVVLEQDSFEVPARVGDTTIRELLPQGWSARTPVSVLALRPSDWMSPGVPPPRR
jgi:hypothetical protein